MRLITKTTLLYFLISIPLLIFAFVYTFSVINEEITDGTDEGLYREKLNMQELIKNLDGARNIYLRSDSLTAIIVLPGKKKINSFSDTVVYDKLEEGELRYRVHRSYFFHNGTHYLISVCKPGMEEEELKEGLIYCFSIVFGLLLLSFFTLNILASRILWKPFRSTLKKLDAYDINAMSEIKFDPSSTKEFRQLNTSLDKMTQKIISDYRKQKEFTENASHELQTPLAVIKSKLDLLIQSKKLGSEELELLQGMENAVQKISALNKALLLLTKIENNQFKEQKEVNLHTLVNAAIVTYSDIYQGKGITSRTEFKGETILRMNPVLADLLISNLIQNAFRHNKENGEMRVELDPEKLVISNSGAALNISADELFERFKKNDGAKESLGLGLSIVKSIIDTYGFGIEYTYIQGQHRFTVKFN